MKSKIVLVILTSFLIFFFVLPGCEKAIPVNDEIPSFDVSQDDLDTPAPTVDTSEERPLPSVMPSVIPVPSETVFLTDSPMPTLTDEPTIAEPSAFEHPIETPILTDIPTPPETYHPHEYGEGERY